MDFFEGWSKGQMWEEMKVVISKFHAFKIRPSNTEKDHSKVK